jgi:hypothetical protein
MNQKRTASVVALAALAVQVCVAAAPSQPAAQTAAAPASRFDFNGFWSSGFDGLGAGPARPTESNDIVLSLPLRNGDIANLTNDHVLLWRSGNNLPLFKPEYWDQVIDLDWNGNQKDPFNHCMPIAPPRLDPPRKIVLLPNEVILFHSVPFQPNEFRIAPIGKRNHEIDRDGTWRGDPVARWEGETLVIETEGFNTDSWFGAQGYVHGYDLKVTERFRPDGDKLVYEVTVEDPEYLVKPWVKDPVVMRRVVKPDVYLEESPPCSERDNKNIVSKQREL